MSDRRAILTHYVPIALIGIALIGLRPVLRQASYEAGLRETANIQPVPVGEFLGTAFIGGFRAVAVDVAWVRAMRLQQEQKWYELLALYDLIADLQPRLEPVWAFNAWNMAFNISNAVETDEAAWPWVKRGLDFLTRGCERNPRFWRLRTTLAQMYFIRCGSVNDERTRYYHRRLYEETGKSNWEWCIYWTEQALATSGQVPPYSWNYIAVSLDEMAREAIGRGDMAEMRALRYREIDSLQQILERFPKYEPGETRIRETNERLSAYELTETAERLRKAGDTDGWLKAAGEITTIWERLLAADPWDEETIRNLKAMATAYAEQAPVLRLAGRSADADRCEGESQRLWRLLAERTTDEDAAGHAGEAAGRD